jgi:uncharacterized protein (TIRG00374 family)
MMGEFNFKEIRESKILWYGVSTAILLGLIYLADFRKFIGALSSVEPFSMLIALLLGLSVFPVWGYVWHSLFKITGIETTLKKSYKIFLGGNFMNSVTPLGQIGGEPFMAYIVSKNTNASYEKSLSTVISADLVNAIPFLIFTVVGVAYLLVFETGMNQFMRNITYLIFALISVLSLVTYLIWFRSNILRSKVSGWLKLTKENTNIESKLLDKIDEKIENLWDTFEEAGKKPIHLAKLVSLSHIAILAQFGCLYFILSGMGVEPNFSGVFLTVILGSMALWSPTPGGTGTIEAAFSALLIFFYPAIGIDTAVASAVLFRLTTFWPGILIGYISLISLGGTRK